MQSPSRGKEAVEIDDCVVIGGGAAGMHAAIRACERGERVSLLEGNSQLGRKILISGNGRCNFTNLDGDNLDHYHGRRDFIRDVLAAFPLDKTLEFFAGLGINWKEEKRGRLFPRSDQAQSMLDVLEDTLAKLGVRVWTDAKIRHLDCVEGVGFEARDEHGREWRARRAVLASGGVSVGKLGADSSGMRLAEELGHTKSDLYPGLVALASRDPFVRRMQGVKVWAEVSAPLSAKRTIVDTDDLLLTKYGVSGFSILNLSAQVVPVLSGSSVTLNVNLFPGETAEQVSDVLKTRWQQNPHRALELSFAGLLNRKIVRPLLDKLQLPRDTVVGAMDRADRARLARELSAWEIEVTEARSFDHAEVTIGGMHTQQIDSATLESLHVPGLHFCGEMMDVHGDLGGYNFQWAWASGYVAGCSGSPQRRSAQRFDTLRRDG